MSLTIVISGQNYPYIGDHLEECLFHWWSVGRMHLTLVDSVKNGHTIVISGKNIPYHMVISWRHASFITGQCEECLLP